MDEPLKRTIKIGILGHFLAALLFLTFLEPIVTGLGRWFAAIPGFIIGAYRDRLYAELATGSIDYAFFIVVLIFGTPIAATVGFLSARLSSRFGRSRESKDEKLLAGHMRWLRRARAVLWFLILCGCAFVITDAWVRVRTLSSFEQHLNIITPSITDQEREEILARWASMQSRAEYYAIVKRMQEIARQHGLALPPNKMYPALWNDSGASPNPRLERTGE